MAVGSHCEACCPRRTQDLKCAMYAQVDRHEIASKGTGRRRYGPQRKYAGTGANT
jgi:hypothetical protein